MVQLADLRYFLSISRLSWWSFDSVPFLAILVDKHHSCRIPIFSARSHVQRPFCHRRHPSYLSGGLCISSGPSKDSGQNLVETEYLVKASAVFSQVLKTVVSCVAIDWLCLGCQTCHFTGPLGAKRFVTTRQKTGKGRKCPVTSDFNLFQFAFQVPFQKQKTLKRGDNAVDNAVEIHV